MALLVVVCSILSLVLLTTWCKLNPFLAFLLVCIAAGLVLGMPATAVMKAIEKGMGETLGSILIVIVAGAMLGKLLAETGAAKQVATGMMQAAGPKRAQWAMVATGFLVGIPLFYNAGFVLLVPLVFSVAAEYKLPLLYIGVPMLAALSVTHGFLPPHPSPVALISMLHANTGTTLFYGFIIAIPAIVIAGPLFARSLKHIPARPMPGWVSPVLEEAKMPKRSTSFVLALLPVLLIAAGALLSALTGNSRANGFAQVLGNPSIVILVSLLISLFTLRSATGKSMRDLMKICADAVQDVAMLLLLFAGAGALKEVLLETGVSSILATMLSGLHMPPLLLGWLMAAIIRVCIGSATIAGLTAVGMVVPLMGASGADPNLMVLAIGAGSLMFSHVNDTGFWMFKSYFHLSITDTIRSWSLMETIVSLVGLTGVLLLNMFVG